MRQSDLTGWQTVRGTRKRRTRSLRREVTECYGNTPFNLLAPSRLIYPVYTVYRNKFPRPAGQGASLIERLFTGISGSQTGGQGVLDVSMSELVQTGGSFGTWPLSLPTAGSQTEVTLNIPYRSV
jgi:hypothetical protein